MSTTKHAPPFLSEAVLEALGFAGIGVSVTVKENERIRPLYISDRMAELLGRPREVLAAHDIFEFIAPESLQQVREHSSRWENEEPAQQHMHVTILKPGGERMHGELGIARVDLDGRAATVAFMIDVSDREHAQRAARASEGRFRRLVDAAPEPMAIVRDEEVIFANEAMRSVLGVSVGSAWPSPSEELREHLRAPPATPIRLNVALASKDSVLHLELTVFAVDFAEGPASIVMARDQTSRLKVQSRLVSADRLASLGSLASGVAHSVNNPLTTVLLNLASLERDLRKHIGGEIGDRLLEKLASAHAAAERVRSCMRQLRGFATWRESPGDVDVRSILDAVLGLVDYAASPAVDLVNDYESVPLVRADEASLAQVFLALLRNALQALPEQAAQSTVLVRTFLEPPNRVVVEVSDSGVGIAEGDLARIFEPFFSTDNRGHSGLGLTVCQEVITQLGGTIQVTSRADPTTFRVELPASTTTEPSDDVRPHILLIDPHVESAADSRGALVESYRVRVVGSSQRGLEVVLGGDRFDLVICDETVDPISLWREIASRRPGLEGKLVVAGSDPTIPVGEIPHIDKPIRAESVTQALVGAGALPAK